MSADEKIQALIIPLRAMNLIVPQALVAEIIPLPHIAEAGDLPWISGIFDWREQKVPLVSIERFCNPDEDDSSSHRSRRLAVLHAMGDVPDVEQYGIEIGSIPHPVRLGEEDVMPMQSAKKPCEMIARHVQAAGVKAVIPDFTALENRVAQALRRLSVAAPTVS